MATKSTEVLLKELAQIISELTTNNTLSLGSFFSNFSIFVDENSDDIEADFWHGIMNRNELLDAMVVVQRTSWFVNRGLKMKTELGMSSALARAHMDFYVDNIDLLEHPQFYAELEKAGDQGKALAEGLRLMLPQLKGMAEQQKAKQEEAHELASKIIRLPLIGSGI